MRTQRIKIAFTLLCLFFCLRTLGASFAQTQTPAAPAAPAQKQPINYEKFTHKSHEGAVKIPGSNQTRDLKCDSCHERIDLNNGLVGTTDRNKQLSLKFPGHKACVDCHVVQFTSQPQQTCTICHDVKAGLNARPPQRDFQKRYDFNAFFDAKQHEMHVTYQFPAGQKLAGQKVDCNYCHAQTGRPAFLTIASHPECYSCHSPQSGDEKAAKKSGCVVCHTATELNAQPFTAKYTSRAYGALFTHKAHVGYVNNDCEACHTINGGYNRPAPTLLKVKQHLGPNEKSGKGCFSCHDGGQHYGRTVFSGEPGDNGGGSCNRCHTRNDYKVFPTIGN